MARMNLFVENQKSSTRQPQHNLKSNQKSPINNNNNNKSKNTTNSTAKSATTTTTTAAAVVVSVPNNKVQSSPIRIFTRSRQPNPGQTYTGCPNTQQSINNTTPPRFSTSTGCPVVVLQTSTPIAVPRKQHRQIQNFFGNSNDDSSSSNSDNDDSLLNNSYYMPPGYPVICGGGGAATGNQNSSSLNLSNSSSGVSSLSSSPSGSTQSSLDGSTLSASSRYAGCKWTEPPSPLTLPQPPQHWTKSPLLTSAEQSHSAPVAMVMNRQQHPQQQQQLSKASTVKKAVKPVKSCCEQQQQLFDVTRQLKMLLKVQA